MKNTDRHETIVIKASHSFLVWNTLNYIFETVI